MQQQIREKLSALVWDELGCDLVTAQVVDAIDVEDGQVTLRLTFGYPFASVAEAYRERLSEALLPHLGGRDLNIGMRCDIQRHRNQKNMPSMRKIKNILAISSAKGGVGKSTTCANLALALAQEGARVGIMDADITGPSQPTMLGVPAGQRPKVKDEKYFVPILAHGIETMSMGYMMDTRTAVVWRGPMIAGALEQMMSQTLWGDLDYLLLDLPPSTSDLQLSLAQKVPVAGALVVTTPQEIALMDAVRGIEMFAKVDVAVLGIAENMAMHICSNCGHADPVFGAGGGERIAADYHTRLLGSLPLARSIREQADAGTPMVVAQPDSPEAVLYRQLARRLAAALSLRPQAEVSFPKVVTEE
jgi:ATP-binding protein involved in chromosome partitioning